MGRTTRSSKTEQFLCLETAMDPVRRVNKGKPSKKKYYLDRETVPIPSDPPTIETVSEYLDSEYW